MSQTSYQILSYPIRYKHYIINTNLANITDIFLIIQILLIRCVWYCWSAILLTIGKYIYHFKPCWKPIWKVATAKMIFRKKKSIHLAVNQDLNIGFSIFIGQSVMVVLAISGLSCQQYHKYCRIELILYGILHIRYVKIQYDICNIILVRLIFKTLL